MLKTVESLFIAYRLTGDRRYRDDGWRIFEAIEKNCRVPSGGYAAIINVDENPATQEDKMETFLMVRDPLNVRMHAANWQPPERDLEVSLLTIL